VAFSWGVRWNGAVPFHLCLRLVENCWSGAIPDTGIYYEDAEPSRLKKRAGPERSSSHTRSFSLSQGEFPAAAPGKKIAAARPSPAPQGLPPSLAPTFGRADAPGQAGGRPRPNGHELPGRAGVRPRLSGQAPLGATRAGACHVGARQCCSMLFLRSDFVFQRRRRHSTSVIAQVKGITNNTQLLLRSDFVFQDCRFCFVVNS
jgi:hypothetical protein